MKPVSKQNGFGSKLSKVNLQTDSSPEHKSDGAEIDSAPFMFSSLKKKNMSFKPSHNPGIQRRKTLNFFVDLSKAH